MTVKNFFVLAAITILSAQVLAQGQIRLTKPTVTPTVAVKPPSAPGTQCTNDDHNITYQKTTAGETWILNGKSIDPHTATFLNNSKLVKSVQHQGSLSIETYSIRVRISIMAEHSGQIIADYMSCVYAH